MNKEKLIKITKNNLYMIIGMFAGAVGGFLYWRFIGCETGNCAIKSNWTAMTIYGGVIGGLLGNFVDGLLRRKTRLNKS